MLIADRVFYILNEIISGNVVVGVTSTKIKYATGEQVADTVLLAQLKMDLKRAGLPVNEIWGEASALYLEWKKNLSNGLKEGKEVYCPFMVAVDMFSDKEVVVLEQGLIPKSFSPASIRKLFPKVPHIPAKLSYNPLADYEPLKMDMYGVECLSGNSYIRPEWMLLEEDLPDEIPEVFKKLIWHVIPDETPREYFFDWLHKSLVDRAYTFLVLCGDKGIGKGLIQQMIFALHGKENAVDGKQSTLSTQFNSQLEDCRLIWFDEAKIAKTDANNLKRILNDYVAIERKGVDTRQVRVYFSAVISNNDVSDNYMEHDDRRFAPLELTHKPWIKHIERKWFGEFDKALSPNSKELAQFGKWLLAHGRKESIKPQEPYLGAKFKEIVEASLARWQEAVIEVLRDEDLLDKLMESGTKDYFLYRDMKKIVGLVASRDKSEQMMRFPKSAKFTDFIRNHRDPDTGLPVAYADAAGRLFFLSEEGLKKYEKQPKQVVAEALGDL